MLVDRLMGCSATKRISVFALAAVRVSRLNRGRSPGAGLKWAPRRLFMSIWSRRFQPLVQRLIQIMTRRAKSRRHGAVPRLRTLCVCCHARQLLARR